MIKVRAHSNIALVKYWGKRNIPLNIPAVGSISITLDALYTETAVSFDQTLPEDRLVLNGQKAREKESARVSLFLNRVREMAGIKSFARVESVNNFPTAAGLASSASAFAALAVAATKAAGMDLSVRDLSVLARLGSGSAARSLFGGFVEMHRGVLDNGSDAYAEPLYDAGWWPLRVIIAITAEGPKKTGSTDGMEHSRHTSPYYTAWVDSADDDLREMRQALKDRDFEKVADISEYSCLKMHALAMSGRPGLIYWNGQTLQLLHWVRELRASGLPVFFTIDAGPQVKIICPETYGEQIAEKVKAHPAVKRIIQTGLGPEAEFING